MSETNPDFDKEQKEVLDSIRVSRVIVPILIGIGVVAYLLWQQFDPEEFAKIKWTGHTLFWIGISLVLLIIRHIAYATRLRVLTKKEFSWLKCIELIFIWEFSSAVSPTSVGGSAVALFVFAQEKLSTARTATIVIYTVVLDAAFFIFTLPLLFLLHGPRMIRPNLVHFNDMDGWGWTFVGAYFLMLTYGAMFALGLFYRPKRMKELMTWVTSFGFLKRYKQKAADLGNDMITASSALKEENWRFHLGAFLSTATAWSCRFLLLNCLIIGIVSAQPIALDFITQSALYARLQAMFVIMAFSPTPGGAGFAEVVFGGFLSDYVPKGISLVIATIWRLLTYYSYLIAGVIIIPNWIRKVLKRRKENRAK